MKSDIDGLVPVVIGITGHRNIPEESYPVLQQKVEEIIYDIKKKIPQTPLILWTGLAEGGDRIGARAAIKCGIDYMVVLPMSQNEYMKDFKTESSKEEFLEFLAKAESSVVMVPSEESFSLEQEPNSPYIQQGKYISRYANILIALWDGIEPEVSGGTGWLVKHFLQGKRDEGTGNPRILNKTETKPVYHILTPRVDSLKLFEGYYTQKLMLQDEGEGLQSINRYNYNLIKYDVKQEDTGISGVKDLAESMFLSADCLSMRLQAKNTFSLKLLTAMGALLVMLILFYDELESDFMLPLYIILFILVMVYFRIFLLGGKLESVQIDCRSLAEGLRIQHFWKLAGLKSEVADFYLWEHNYEVSWVRNALRTCCRETDSGRGKINNEIERFSNIYEKWLLDQADYYEKSAVALTTKNRRLKRLIDSSLLLSLVVIFVAAVMEFFFQATISSSSWPLSKMIETTIMTHMDQHIMVRNWLKIILGILAATAALTGNYRNKLALDELSKARLRMAELFCLAKEKYVDYLACEDYDSLRKLVFELGKEVLAENGSWVAHHRQRPMEVPR